LGPGGFASDPADPLVSADYTGWWRRTLAVIGATWPLLLMLQALGAVVSFLCGVVLSRWKHPSLPDHVQVVDVGVWILAQVVAILVDVVSFTWVTLAVVHVVVLTAAGRRPTLGACLRGAVRRLLPLIGWSLIAAVMIGVGLFLCGCRGSTAPSSCYYWLQSSPWSAARVSVGASTFSMRQGVPR
jgi:hypothetical protein